MLFRSRQSVTRQPDRFKLGRPGHVGLSGPGPLHLQSSSVLAVGGRLVMQGHIRYCSSKVTNRLRLETEGDAVEAIFFAVGANFLVTSILLRLTIDLVMIVLVFGSALLVVWSQKFDR